MGIKDLSKVIEKEAPGAAKKRSLSYFSGKTVAIDASMFLYQFLIAIRAHGSELGGNSGVSSHLIGCFYRTVSFLAEGIRPLYVFDGKPPALKFKELEARNALKAQAVLDANKAKEDGNMELHDQLLKRSVKVTQKHKDECKQLLQLLGVPCFDAPAEAEAQCAHFVKCGVADFVASDDADTLTFGAELVIKNFTSGKKKIIEEYSLSSIRRGLELSQDAFIELCVVLGCDYAPRLRGVGPSKAVALIKKHGSIDEILKNNPKLDASGWPYKEAIEYFKRPEIETEFSVFNWTEPDKEGVMRFLTEEHNFSKERVENALRKVSGEGKKTNKKQVTLDFF